MPVDRSFLGVESEDRFIEVEKGQLKLFAMATGESDPAYSSEEAARARGYRNIPAPPTFVFGLTLLAPAKKGSMIDMVDNVGAVLHGEQEFTYHQMIYAGDRLRLKTKTVDIYDKKGGKMEFIVQDTTVHNQDDVLCVTARTVAIYRN